MIYNAIDAFLMLEYTYIVRSYVDLKHLMIFENWFLFTHF